MVHLSHHLTRTKVLQVEHSQEIRHRSQLINIVCVREICTVLGEKFQGREERDHRVKPGQSQVNLLQKTSHVRWRVEKWGALQK